MPRTLKIYAPINTPYATMFNVSSYEDKTALRYNCDESVYLRRYIKNNETLRQFATRMHYGTQQEPIKTLNENYHTAKQTMAKKNSEYRNKSHKLHDLLRDCCMWNYMPYKNIVFDNVRWLIYDGNSREFVAETSTHFYMCVWGGS
jgi:hypothetical protein